MFLVDSYCVPSKGEQIVLIILEMCADKRKVLRRLKVLQKEWSACTDATER